MDNKKTPHTGWDVYNDDSFWTGFYKGAFWAMVAISFLKSVVIAALI